MTFLLRQIVASPRAKHEETGLDLCYVTSKIIATSGPSQTFPQRAYRNPLDRLVAFLDEKHGDGWAIWEFRAEGTGYPDDAVYHRIRHFPWPDHHPPPFRLVPMIVAGMRNWLAGGELEGGKTAAVTNGGEKAESGEDGDRGRGTKAEKKKEAGNRVVVVHCKAGKGRSGTMACSYLISECGWTPEDALARFTERRMRPKFGAGVSIPSQLRWVSYVDRWTRGGKHYIDREVEVVEVHVWGLRNGVKVAIEEYVDDGKRIRVVHTFKREERIVVEGDAPGGAGVVDLVSDMAGYGLAERDDSEIVEDADYEAIANGKAGKDGEEKKGGLSPSPSPSRSGSIKRMESRASSLMRKISTRRSKSSQSLSKLGGTGKSKTIAMPEASQTPPIAAHSPPGLGGDGSQSKSTANLQSTGFSFADPMEPGGQAVIFKPAKPIRIANGDINVTVERRNRAPASMGLTMVTAVAHVWFNTFFEGKGPEQDGKADDSGVFEIDWDTMDGIKGSSQKGTRACDRLSVVWRVAGTSGDGTAGGEEQRDAEGGVVTAAGVTINEPGEDSPVPQVAAADWKGGNKEDPAADRHLGLRVQDPDSASVSRASSVKSDDEIEAPADDEPLAGVKISGPMGEDALDVAPEQEALKPSPAAIGGDKALPSDAKADAIAQKGFVVE